MAFFVFFIILLRLYFIQIKATDCFYFNGEVCKENILDEAKKRQIHLVKISAQRGSIYDRNYDILAMSLPSKTLCINPSKLYRNYDKSITMLARELNISEKKINSIILKNT